MMVVPLMARPWHSITHIRDAEYAGKVMYAVLMVPAKPAGVGNVRYVMFVLDAFLGASDRFR